MGIGFVCLGLGLVSNLTGLFLYVSAHGKTRMVDSWPSAPCQILESFVKRATGYASNEGQPRQSYHVAVVRYAYWANGRELLGGRETL